MLDHSAIYRSARILDWHHRARLRRLLDEVGRFRAASSVADIGCSNGYVTNLISAVCEGKVYGFDYSPDLLDRGRALYPHIEFRQADLNTAIPWDRTFDLVCCFETLEHAGDLACALRNLAAAVSDGGTLIVSMPVEVGLWGLAKYVAKTLNGYAMDEIDAGRGEYFWALLTGRDISRFRGEKYAWGTHYGFDWRIVERRIATDMRIEKSYTKFATRIIVARKE